MKLSNLLIIVFAVLLITVSSTFLIFSNQMELKSGFQYDSIPYTFTVSSVTGVDVATDKLRLGSLPPLGKSQRDISIEREGATKAVVRFIGPGSQMLRAEPAEVVLVDGKGGFQVQLEVSANAEFQQYDGLVRVYFFDK